MGLILVFDRASGELVAILHDGLLQKMRVGADSALGARYMSRPDSSVLAILGAGGMARAHVDAMRAVRPIIQRAGVQPDPGQSRGLRPRDHRAARHRGGGAR